MGLDWDRAGQFFRLAISYGLLVVRLMIDDPRGSRCVAGLSRTPSFVTNGAQQCSCCCCCRGLIGVMVGCVLSMTSLGSGVPFPIGCSIFCSAFSCSVLFDRLLLSFFRGASGWLIWHRVMDVDGIGAFSSQWKLEDLLLCRKTQFEGQRMVDPWDLWTDSVRRWRIARTSRYILFLGGGRRLLEIARIGSESRRKTVAIDRDPQF